MADSDRLTRVLNDYAPKYAIPIFAAVGFLTILRPVLSYIRLIFSLFILRGTSLQKYGRKGSWALITGASDGIGKEYAVQLAAAGFNVVLVSRTDSKLQMLAHDIENRYAAQGIKAKTLAMDFARNDDADYAKLKALVDGLDIAVLVNNVGKSHDIPVPFVLTPKEEVLDIVTINCIGTLRVTQIVAAGMIQRKRGLILTMGSFGGFIPTPLLATYSGSKAFLQQWSTALGSELKPHGVQVELVLSYLVTSAMSKIRRPTIMIPTPKKFVKSVLSKVGRSGGAQGMASTSTPFWSHGIAHWWIVTCLGVYNSFVIDRNRVMHESIRSRALKKKERDPKKLS